MEAQIYYAISNQISKKYLILCTYSFSFLTFCNFLLSNFFLNLTGAVSKFLDWKLAAAYSDPRSRSRTVATAEHGSKNGGRVPGPLSGSLAEENAQESPSFSLSESIFLLWKHPFPSLFWESQNASISMRRIVFRSALCKCILCRSCVDFMNVWADGFPKW